MRSAEEFVRDYRKRDYSDERIRILANLAREPMKSEILAILGSSQEKKMKRQGNEEEVTRPRARHAAARGASDKAEPREEEPADSEAPAETSALGAQLERQRERAEELHKVTGHMNEMSRQLDQLRDEMTRARQREAELEAAIEAAQHERREAIERAEELSERIAADAQTVAHLKDKLAEKDDQANQLRSRFDQESVLARRETEQETRLLRRRVSQYKKIGLGATAVAFVLFLAIIIPPLVSGSSEEKAQPTTTTGLYGIEPITATTPTGSELTGVTTVPTTTPISTAPVAPTTTPTTPTAPRTISYTVKRGDNLTTICRSQLGDASRSTLDRVKRENSIADEHKLMPGAVLKLTIPPQEERRPGP